jgi:hypothetical protein
MAWFRSNSVVETNNKFYNTTDKGGYSINIKGTDMNNNVGVGLSGANVLCNCTGFATGAFNETYIKSKYGTDSSKWPPNKFPYHFRGNACYFLDGIRIQYAKVNKLKLNTSTLDYPKLFSSVNKSTSQTNWGDSSVASLYNYILPPTARPPKGGLIVWGGKRYAKKSYGWTVVDVNHVSYIADVIGNDKITIVQAGYLTPGWSVPVPGGYRCNKRTITRNRGGTNMWWYQGLTDAYGPNKCPDGSIPICLGFIANPAIGIEYDNENNKPNAEETYIPATPDPKDFPPSVSGVIPQSPTSIKVSCSMNGASPITQRVDCYYKWGESVSTSSNNGVFSGTGSFDKVLDKPREATMISILPVQINADGKNYQGSVFKATLTPSYPAVQISDGKTFKSYSPKMYDASSGKWVDVTPVLRDKGVWIKLYNTDSERVKE